MEDAGLGLVFGRLARGGDRVVIRKWYLRSAGGDARGRTRRTKLPRQHPVRRQKERRSKSQKKR